jgi:hypothetical protein
MCNHLIDFAYGCCYTTIVLIDVHTLSILFLIVN